MLLLAAATFIGNQACRECHAEIAEAYAATPMARSSGRVENVDPAEFTAAGQRYRIDGARLLFGEFSAPFDIFIGSGAAGRSYLFQRNGYLFELPVTWYTQKRKWDASPGYERATEVTLKRAIEPNCLACHASRVRPVVNTQNRYGSPPFLDGGVSCERCHGPGSEHVRNPAGAPMVNPAKLAAEERDSVCGQCHLTGEARIELPGRGITNFRAGERLSDYASYLVWAPPAANLKVTSHVEKLAASACKRAAGDVLWCGTCHDVHANRDRTQQACLSCHAAAHHASARDQKEQCANCHMPKTPVVDGGHGVLTDHGIPRVPGVALRPAASELKGFLRPADERALGLAYATLGDSRAKEHLERAQPVDAAVQLWLAVLKPDRERAASLYEAVLRARPADITALVNLGSLYGAAGRLEEAAALWERALQANPALEQAVFNLASIRKRDGARALLQAYLEYNPASREARKRLAALE